MKNIICFVLSLSCFSLAVAEPIALDTKNQAIEIVVPFGPGGAATNSAQFIAKVLKEQGLRVVVTNKPGNNGIIAANYVATSAPTGHTLFLGSTSTVVSNVAFKADQQGMEYNERSFVPVVMTNRAAIGLVISSTSDIQNYKQFKEFVKKNPQKFNVGSYNSTFGYIFKEWAKKEGLPEPTIVLYKGSSQLVIDVASGVLFSAFDNIGGPTPAMPLLDGGQIRMIATLDNSASKKIKEINKSTVDIAQLQPSVKFSVWNGLFAPAGTPKSVVVAINRAVNSALTDPTYQETVSFMEGLGGSSEEMAALVNKDFVLLKSLADKTK
jgi:tripartite-type tricarboxylate transporter receptor subunit TctC